MNWIYNVQAFLWLSMMIWLSFFSAISGLHLPLRKRMAQESKVVIYLLPGLAIATKCITRRNTRIYWDEHTESATANWWNRDAIDWWYFKGEWSSWHFPLWRSGFRKRTRRTGKQRDKHWTGPPYTCKNKYPELPRGPQDTKLEDHDSELGQEKEPTKAKENNEISIGQGPLTLEQVSIFKLPRDKTQDTRHQTLCK